MPNWAEVSKEIIETPPPFDAVRKKYLDVMHQYTGRNIIAYYSAFLQKPGLQQESIDDNDKNAFMQAVHGLDKKKGLDLILHTPGGGIAATESIVVYLKKMFGDNIRVFVPQIAMSAGTMIALSAKEIVMGKQSNLGPIDPQFNGVSCAGILEEFHTALASVKADPSTAPIWSLIIGKYHPTFIGDCNKAIMWSKAMVKDWLSENMLSRLKKDKEKRINKIVETLSSHSDTYSHQKHLHIDYLKDLGLKIVALEGLDDRPIDRCADLQDCLLTLHHTYMQTLAKSNAVKIIENHKGNSMILTLQIQKKG